jgi:hypothetical protein
MTTFRIIEKAGNVPNGATVFRLGEPRSYILGSTLAGWDYGSHKRDPIVAPSGNKFLIENVSLGIGTMIPNSLEVVWLASLDDIRAMLVRWST